MAHYPAKKDLDEAIKRFLKDRRKSINGGWADVNDVDMACLGTILLILARLKCEPDADGDIPIEWTLTNRTKYNRNHFRNVPYKEGLGAAILNVKLASESLDRASDEIFNGGEDETK